MHHVPAISEAGLRAINNETVTSACLSTSARWKTIATFHYTGRDPYDVL